MDEQNYLDFLRKVSEAIANSNSDPKVAFPLLQANLDKLDNNFVRFLQTWATAKLSEVETDTTEFTAKTIWDLSYCLSNFPLSDKANNMEIVIAGYEAVLKVFTREGNRENWAAIQNNLGIAYSDRIRGNRAQNLENAIATYNLVLEVCTKESFPIDWATTQYNLGIVYRNRIRGDRAQNLENAIAAYNLALEVYTKKDFPMYWAMTQNNRGNAYRNRIRGDRAQNLENAIAAYNLALEVYTKKDLPNTWAMTQNNLGIAYKNRIRGDRVQNLENAIAAYNLTLEVYTKKDLPMYWAMTQNNLGIAYSDRIRGNRAQNLENAVGTYQSENLELAIASHKKALEIYNLGSTYSNKIRHYRGENLENPIEAFRSENLELAIAAYQNASEVYTREAFPEEWAEIQHNIGKLLVQQGKWYDGLSHLEQTLAFYRQTENLESRADTIYQIARTHHLMSNLDKARLHYCDALRIYQHINNQPGIATCKTGLGRLMISIGYIDDALHELNQAWQIYDTINHKLGIENTQELIQFIHKIREKQST
ncbi:MAG: tetratricopeptide repeat protein [Okeania sp. SIO3I5]|uniref:tetratricopeptide repeat protein n=1 Tax=Okeania sp. SIO3I5 TaxID=2607805 RepID=UPI0013BA2759|nr:tetratricopeptide repeat protein [Okeania sp. SIO3I5]NEQ40188.1 tetratricopeptide repeat protein [Okeania sp. SIO3I5]